MLNFCLSLMLIATTHAGVGDEIQWMTSDAAFDRARNPESRRWVLVYRGWPDSEKCRELERRILPEISWLIEEGFFPVKLGKKTAAAEGVASELSSLCESWDETGVLWIVSAETHDCVLSLDHLNQELRPEELALRLRSSVARNRGAGPAKLPARSLLPETIDALRSELVAMGELDQEYRDFERVQRMTREERAAFMSVGREVDQRNVQRLEEIVAAFGWPAIPLIGEEAARCAFLIVQHADERPAFQKLCLPILEEQAETGQIAKLELAYLTDRVRVKEGRPQVYGTQYDVEDDPGGGFRYLIPRVIDVDHLDDRRRAAGLGPWIEYERKMAQSQGREPVEHPRPAESDG